MFALSPEWKPPLRSRLRQIAPALAVAFAKDERNQRGARGLDSQSELAGQIVAKRRGADFRDGQASGGDDQAGRVETDALCLHCELVLICVLAHFFDFCVEQNFHSSIAAFLLQHGNDVTGSSIAEQPAELFLVIRDAMFFDEANEVGGRIARECRLGEVGVGRKKIFGGGVEVGEIAAAAAGDQDFLADAVGALEDDDAASALAGFDGTHQAGSACSENDDVVVLFHAETRLAGASVARGLITAGIAGTGLLRLRPQRLQECNNLPALGLRELRPNRHTSANHAVGQEPEKRSRCCLLHFLAQ